jgi:hypothetical protein
VIARFIFFIAIGTAILLASSSQLHAEDGQPPTGPVVLTDGQAVYPLGRQLDLLADPTGSLTIDDVRSPAYSEQFVDSRQEMPILGLSATAYWARVAVRNASSEPMWILALAPYEQDQVDFYLYDGSGQAIAAQQTGSELPFKTRDLPAPGFVFRAPIQPGQEATVYLRNAGEYPLRFPVTLYSLPAFVEGNDIGLLLSAGAYGFFAADGRLQSLHECIAARSQLSAAGVVYRAPDCDIPAARWSRRSIAVAGSAGSRAHHHSPRHWIGGDLPALICSVFSGDPILRAEGA